MILARRRRSGAQNEALERVTVWFEGQVLLFYKARVRLNSTALPKAQAGQDEGDSAGGTAQGG
jgi:hypothetical protein